MSKLLFNFKPECNRKANETHTQSSAEIEDVTPKPPPSPSVSPQKCVPSSPAAGQNEENQVVPPDDPPKSESPLVPPQKLAPGSPADEIEENQAVEPESPLVSPQKLAPGSPADEIEENQAVEPPTGVTTKIEENQAARFSLLLTHQPHW